MQLRGHMLEVEWDGELLTARGTNRAAQVALRGQQHADGPLVLHADDISAVDIRPATMLANGRLTLHTTDGSKYLLHYRRGQASDFTELADALQHP